MTLDNCVYSFSKVWTIRFLAATFSMHSTFTMDLSAWCTFLLQHKSYYANLIMEMIFMKNKLFVIFPFKFEYWHSFNCIRLARIFKFCMSNTNIRIKLKNKIMIFWYKRGYFEKLSKGSETWHEALCNITIRIPPPTIMWTHPPIPPTLYDFWWTNNLRNHLFFLFIP